jgi:hypothetical protein
MRPTFVLSACLALFLVWLPCGVAHALPLSESELEDAVLDGEYDVEDLASFREARPYAPPSHRPGTYVALQAHAGSRLDGLRELGAAVVFQIPLDGWGTREFASQGARATLAQEEWTVQDEPDLPSARTVFSVPALTQDARAPVPGPRAALPINVTFEVARACVHAAWQVAGVAEDDRIDGLAGRARWSAVLPELRLRLARNIDESGRLSTTLDDPAHYTEAGGTSHWMEARLTFRLDRVLFADEEIALERLRADRAELRSRTAAKALHALFEWQRAYTLAADASLTVADHWAAVGRELETSAVLDVMTDGWFARYRSSLAVRER